MRDWKFVQVGNETPLKVGDIVEVFGKKGKVTKVVSSDVVEVFFDNSGTNDPDRTDRYYTSEVKKVGNESIDKQEWSMFHGLKKDAEKEVENGTPGSIASIGPAWSHGGTVYGKMDTDDSGKRHTKYVKITWLGDGKGGVANYFIDDKMQSDKLGSLDKNELKRWAEAKIGNAKTVNSYKRDEGNGELRNEYNAEIHRLEKKMEELYRRGQGHSAMQVQKQIEQLQKELRELGNSKIGNKKFVIEQWTPFGTIKIGEWEAETAEQAKREFEQKNPAYANGKKGTITAMATNSKTGNETKKSDKVDNAQWSRSYYKEKIDPAKWNEFEREFDKLNQRHIEEKTLAEQDGKRPDFEKQKREAEMVVKKYATNNLQRARNAMKIGNLDHVDEGDYVDVRINGELVEGVVRKIQGTQALVTVNGTDQWFPIRSLKEPQ